MKNAAAVLESLAKRVEEERNFAELVVQDVAEFASNDRVDACGDVLAWLLQAIESPQILEWLFEEYLIPRSPRLAIVTVDRMLERRPKRMLDLLMWLHQHESVEIRDHAEERLVSLATNAASIEAWAPRIPRRPRRSPRVFRVSWNERSRSSSSRRSAGSSRTPLPSAP